MKPTKTEIRQLAARYPRVIEWSDEDKCFIGSAPPLVGQCCHGDTETEVAKQLAVIVEDLAEDFLTGKMTVAVPAGLANKTYSGKFVVRVSPGHHKKAALKAAARGESLNEFVAAAIDKS